MFYNDLFLGDGAFGPEYFSSIKLQEYLRKIKDIKNYEMLLKNRDLEAYFNYISSITYYNNSLLLQTPLNSNNETIFVGDNLTPRIKKAADEYFDQYMQEYDENIENVKLLDRLKKIKKINPRKLEKILSHFKKPETVIEDETNEWSQFFVKSIEGLISYYNKNKKPMTIISLGINTHREIYRSILTYSDCIGLKHGYDDLDNLRDLIISLNLTHGSSPLKKHIEHIKSHLVVETRDSGNNLEYNLLKDDNIRSKKEAFIVSDNGLIFYILFDNKKNPFTDEIFRAFDYGDKYIGRIDENGVLNILKPSKSNVELQHLMKRDINIEIDSCQLSSCSNRLELPPIGRKTICSPLTSYIELLKIFSNQS